MPDVAAIADAMRGHRTLVVTGAGISTAAGVPDYRGTPDRRSVEYEDFVLHEIWYRYVWWRNEMSWTLLRQVAPTAGHRALARLEEAGYVAKDANGRLALLPRLTGTVRILGSIAAGFPTAEEEQETDAITLDEFLVKKSFNKQIIGKEVQHRHI